MGFSLFFDSSAFYSAVYSSKGAARELLHLSIQGKVWIVVSQDVLDETRRNIAAKAAEMLDVYDLLLTILDFEMCPVPSLSEVREAEKYVASKDAPIVAAAKKARVDYLITFDKRHLLGNPALASYMGIEILTPKEGLAHILSPG